MNAPVAVDDLDALLVGKVLEGRWRIDEPRAVARDGLSHHRTYVAHDEANQPVFVKVLDPRGHGSLAEQKEALDQFAYEDAVVSACGQRKMRRVIRGLASGEILVPGPLAVHVRYLVFEWADSDIRSALEHDEASHLASALRWLHHVATGLHALHFSRIVHLDLKPANILVLPDRSAKVGDLSKAYDHSQPRPNGAASHDAPWAPLEVLYGSAPVSFDDRCAADMYQLGSLAVFLMSSVGLTVQIERRVPQIHHWTRWQGPYEDALPHLRPYYDECLEGLAEIIPEFVRERFLLTIRQLTDPDPRRRGHPSNIRGSGPRYGFERFVSEFNVLAARAEQQIRLDRDVRQG